MTRTKVAQWAFENGVSNYSYDELGEMYAENGLRGIEEAVLGIEAANFRDVAGSRDCNERDCYVDAFNSVTNGWHYRVRPLLAEFLANDPYDYNEQFEDELMEFVAGEQMDPEDRDGIQLTLGTDFEANPFDDPSLSEDEAIATLAARMAGYDDDEYDVENVEDGRSFARRLFESKDLQYSINASHFDGRLPDDMIGDVAEPDNWESDPSDIPMQTCTHCGDDFYEVTTSDGREVYLSANGEELRYTNISDRDDVFTHQSSEHEGVCRRCYTDDVDREVYIISADGIARLDIGRAVAANAGDSEQEFISAATFSDSLSSMALDVGFRDFDNESLLQLSPGDGPTSAGTVRRQIESTIENPTEYDHEYDEPIVVEYTENYTGENYYVYADRSNWNQCRAAKEFMQEMHA